MPNAYNWIISQLECYPEHGGKQDVVFSIHWRRQATDGTYMADAYGSQNVTLDPSAPFTSFDQLTKEQVEGWLEAAMGQERVAEIDALLDSRISEQVSPTVTRPPLPWLGG